MVRAASGTHPFRVEHLREAYLAGAPEPEAEAEVAEVVEGLAKLIEDGYCPRCHERPLPDSDPVTPSGSRMTACRCIPVCSECGGHESLPELFGGFTPWQWWHDPLTPEQVDDDLDAMRRLPGVVVSEAIFDPGTMTLTDEEGVTPVTLREHPGGWADPDNIVEEGEE